MRVVFAPNVDRILAMLSPSDVVLDIGGWGCPFNRADWVVDAEPWDTRGFYAEEAMEKFQGPAEERFTKDTWIRRDICDKAPLPFADKQIDFVVCSQVLEDVRDPLWVCSEMRRIAKRGYIEVPSREAESSRGWEDDRIAGLSHHRWLVEIHGSSIEFLMKPHSIHQDWRFSFPPSYFHSLAPEKRVQWLLWDGDFTFSERTVHGVSNLHAELAGYVDRVHPYPRWRIGAARAHDEYRWQKFRITNGVKRRLGRV